MKLKNWILSHYKILVSILIVLSIPAIYLFVFYTGGIKFVYSHTMYIPIVLAGIVIGSPFGMLVALVGGIILGPLMPIDVTSQEPQELVNWIYRLLMFLGVGALTDYFSGSFKKTLELNKQLYSINLETHVPNINFLLNMDDTDQRFNVATVIISDRNNIEEVFGYEIFKKVVSTTYLNLMMKIGGNCQVIQPDTNKMWVIMEEEDSNTAADRIMKALSEPVVIDEMNIFVEYYLGVGNNYTLQECKSLIPFRISDQFARYAEKNNLPFVIYDEKLLKKKYEIELLVDFKSALTENDTYLVYHPVWNLETKTIYGFEALIRWKHPDKGLVMPNDFIPIVEKTQLIHYLLEWVIGTGLRKMIEFKKKKIITRVAFNISGKNFNDKNLYERVMSMVEKSGVNPALVGVEVTETVLMSNPEGSKQTIRNLREKGIHIAIDDFGKGYSSLTYLSQFDIDYIKIDRYFIANIDDPSICEIVKATINLAHQLEYKVVAEGVENKETMDKLIEYKCDYAQGFYFCKPIHQDEVIDYYIKNKKFILEEDAQDESPSD